MEILVEGGHHMERLSPSQAPLSRVWREEERSARGSSLEI